MRRGSIVLPLPILAVALLAAYGSALAQGSPSSADSTKQRATSQPATAIQTPRSADNTESGKIVVLRGFKIGVRWSGFSGDGSEEMDGRALLAFGGFITYGSDFFAIQPELWYSQRGAGNYPPIKLNYIEIPLLIKVLNPIAYVFFRDKDRAKRMLYVGPVVGIKISSTVESHVGKAKSLALSLAAGGDAYRTIGKSHQTRIYFDFRLTFGLSSPFDDSGFGGQRLKHLSMDWLFGLAF